MTKSDELKAVLPLLERGYQIQLSAELAREIAKLIHDYDEARRQLASLRGA